MDLGDEYEPFVHWTLVPPDLRDVLFNVTWTNPDLWALPLPVAQVRVADLEWQLDRRWCRDGDRLFAITPTQVPTILKSIFVARVSVFA